MVENVMVDKDSDIWVDFDPDSILDGIDERMDAIIECVHNVFSFYGIFGGVFGRADREYDRVRINNCKEDDS